MMAVRGEPVAVLIPNAEYVWVTQPKSRFVKFIRSSPLFGIGLDAARHAN